MGVNNNGCPFATQAQLSSLENEAVRARESAAVAVAQSAQKAQEDVQRAKERAENEVQQALAKVNALLPLPLQIAQFYAPSILKDLARNSISGVPPVTDTS